MWSYPGQTQIFHKADETHLTWTKCDLSDPDHADDPAHFQHCYGLLGMWHFQHCYGLLGMWFNTLSLINVIVYNIQDQPLFKTVWQLYLHVVSKYGTTAKSTKMTINILSYNNSYYNHKFTHAFGVLINTCQGCCGGMGKVSSDLINQWRTFEIRWTKPSGETALCLTFVCITVCYLSFDAFFIFLQ